MHLHPSSHQNHARCWIRVITCVVSGSESSVAAPLGSQWFQAELRNEGDGQVVCISGWTRNRSVAFRVAEQWLIEQDALVAAGLKEWAIESRPVHLSERQSQEGPRLQPIEWHGQVERLAVVVVALFVAIMVYAAIFIALLCV